MVDLVETLAPDKACLTRLYTFLWTVLIVRTVIARVIPHVSSPLVYSDVLQVLDGYFF